MRVLYLEADTAAAELTRAEFARRTPPVELRVAPGLVEARRTLGTPAAPDVVLVALEPGDGQALELVAEVHRQGLPFAVVALTPPGDAASALAALRAGADGYVSRREGYLSRLPENLREVLERTRTELPRSRVLRILYGGPGGADSARVLSHLADHAPHMVVEAVDGADAVLGRLRAAPGSPPPFDVLLLDVHPLTSGALDVVERIRNERRLDLPIVLLVAPGEQETAALAQRLGATEPVLNTPDHLYALPAVIEGAHHRAAAARETAALRESAARLRLILDTEPECVKIVAPDGTLEQMNAAGLEMLEAGSLEEARRQNLIEFLLPEHRDAFVGLHKRVMGGGRGSLEFEVEGLLGQRRWLETHAAPLRGPSGQVAGLLGVTRDVTERKRNEALLRESEERFRQIAESVGEVFWMTDVSKGRMLYVSPAYESIWGRSPESLYANPRAWLDAVHPGDRGRVSDAAHTLQAAGAYDLEYRIVRPDGGERWIHDRAFQVRDADGQVYRIAGVAGDVTPAKRAAQSLRDSEEKFAKAFDSSPDALVIASLDEGRLAEVNESFVRASGFSRDEAIGRTTRELGIWIEPQNRDVYAAALREHGSVRDRPARFRSRSGEIYDTLVSGYAVQFGSEMMALTTIRDVTEQKQAERDLEEAAEQQRQILDSVGAILCRVDAATYRFLYISEEAERLLGYPRERWLSEDGFWQDRLHPEDRDRAIAFCQEQTAALRPHSFEYRMFAADGRTVWLKDMVRVIAEGGRPKELVGVMVDVTALKEAEVALRESEARYRSLFESAPDGIFVQTPDGAFLDVNPAALTLLGYTREELLRLQPSDVVASEETPRIEPALDDVLSGAPHRSEWRVKRKDGSLFHADVLRTKLADGRVLGILRDVTERRSIEAQLRQSQKMEAVGRLAGGVAHDFNNILGVIGGYADLLLQKASREDPDREDLEEIARAADRAAGLTRQLLAFSRKQIMEPKVIEPSALMQEMRRLLAPLIGEHIDLVLSANARGRVAVDPGQLEQVLLNLVVNARDAMPDGGRLTVETADVEVTDEDLQRQGDSVTPGPYVMLSVADTGVGMDEATQANAFEPFFSTKPEGRGTGLGLATVYGILQQSGGFISMDSEVGRGTIVRAYLPRVEAALEKREAPRAPLERSATETILLAEDDPAGRKLLAEILGAEGYRVIVAENGEDAVALADQTSPAIDLLVTDVVLPKLSGRAAADRIRSAHPDVRVLYISGYTDDEISRQGVLEPGIALLQKPFTPGVLLRRVGEILDGLPARRSTPA